MKYLLAIAGFTLSSVLFAANTKNPDDPQTPETHATKSVIDQLDAQQESIDQLREQIIELQAESNTDITGTSDSPGKLSFSGYGVINYLQYDFIANTQDTDPERRASTDVERVVLVTHYRFSDSVFMDLELEVEHGGTGATIEYEPEEFGEYEIEIEKGGEIVIEQFSLTILQSTAINWRFGHIIVPFGMVNRYHHPTEYFTTHRSLTETSLFPVVWHETGIALFGSLDKFDYQFLLVTGLDSSRFNSYHFVGDGLQGNLEFSNADSPAVVAAFNYNPFLGLNIGGSIYYGETAQNRPNQNVSVDAYLTLFEAHLRYQRGAWIVRTEWITGSLENSDKLTTGNQNSVNAGELGISSTAVPHGAEGFFIEAGYDFNQLTNNCIGRPLFGFVRYDDFDPLAKIEGNIIDIPRYDQTATTIGLNYLYLTGVAFKTQFTRLKNSGTTVNQQDLFSIGMGLEF